MVEPAFSDLTQLGSISRSRFGDNRDDIPLNPDTLITCKSDGSKLVYYKNRKVHHKITQDITKVISYQYKLEIYSAIYMKIAQTEEKFRRSAQTLTEMLREKHRKIDSEITNYLEEADKAENTKKAMNDQDNKVTFQKFLDDMANKLLLVLFDKSIRMWNLKMVENYERYRLKTKVDADKYLEGGRKILDTLNAQKSLTSSSYGEDLNEKLESHSRFLREMKEIITKNETFTTFQGINELDDQNVIAHSSRILEFADNFINDVLDTNIKIQDFEYQDKLIQNELGIWDARSEFSQEEAASPYINAAIKYLTKKKMKVDHRIAVYETVSRLERLDVNVNEGNTSIRQLTEALASMNLSGSAVLENTTRHHSGTPDFQYYVSSIRENYKINKARVDIQLSDPDNIRKSERQQDNETEKAAIQRDLDAVCERAKGYVNAEQKLREAIAKDDEDKKSFEESIKKFKSKFEKLKGLLLAFHEDHQSTELSLKKDLIPAWICMLTKYLNITKSNQNTKFSDYDFLATTLQPERMIEVLYQILLDNQKIRQKKFRLFGSSKFPKVFTCGVISMDIIIEFLTHPVIYGCFRDDHSLAGQNIDNHLRSENCNQNFIKCIKESINIMIIGEQLESKINKHKCKERIYKIEEDGDTFYQNGHKRFLEKMEKYFMKPRKEKSIKLD